MNIFDFNFLIIPVVRKQHWFVIVASNLQAAENMSHVYQTDHQPILHFINSKGDNDRHVKAKNLDVSQVTVKLRKFFAAEWKKQGMNQEPTFMDNTHLEERYCDSPEQEDDKSCALFMIRNMIEVIKDPGIVFEKIDYPPVQATAMRSQLAIVFTLAGNDPANAAEGFLDIVKSYGPNTLSK